MDLLTNLFLGQPLWMWLGFLGLVIALLAFDLGVLHRKAHEIGVRESLWLSAFYITVGLLFSLWVWRHLGQAAALATQVRAREDEDALGRGRERGDDVGYGQRDALTA